MNKLISCEFNIDTACVELRFMDGSLISIDCTAVETRLHIPSVSGQNWIGWCITTRLGMLI